MVTADMASTPIRLLTKIVSTMFPKNWSPEKLKSEVDVAFANKTLFTNSRGVEMWRGTTPSGVKVEGYLTPNTTVFPSRTQ